MGRTRGWTLWEGGGGDGRGKRLVDEGDGYSDWPQVRQDMGWNFGRQVAAAGRRWVLQGERVKIVYEYVGGEE